MTSRLWVVAGPNGAGKSTIVERYGRGRIAVVNPDIYAASMSPDLGETARVIAAGRMAVRARSEHLATGQPFIIETTLTGHSEITLMHDARMMGFRVSLVYVGIDDLSLSVGRVRLRVTNGGHNVPLADLERRFDRSFAHLREAIGLAKRIILIDNSSKHRRLLYSAEDGRTKFVATDLPAWAAAALA